MNGEQMKRMGIWGRHIVLVGAVAAIAALPAVMGCESDANADASGVVAPGSGAGTAFQPMSPPTLAELKAGAGLNESQSRAIEPALSRWREQAGTMKQARRGRMGQGPDGSGMQSPPMHAFLVDAAKSLDTDHFVAVVGYLADRRDANRTRMHDARTERRAQRQTARQGRAGMMRGDRSNSGMMHGDGPGPGRMHGSRPGSGMMRGNGGGSDMRSFLAGLNLTDAQRTAFRDAMRTARETLRAMHADLAAGNLTATAAHDRAQGAVDALRQALDASWTADQIEALTAHMRERAQTMAERRLANFDTRGGRRDAFLIDALGLDDDQAAALAQARSESLDRTRTLLEGIKEGTTAFPDAVYEGIDIRQDADTALRAILTPDQTRKLDALQRLQRGGGPGFMGIYL